MIDPCLDQDTIWIKWLELDRDNNDFSLSGSGE